MAHYLAFVALVTVLVVVPGPAVLLVMQRALTRGFGGAVTVSAGVFAADLVWAAAAALGVTALLVASEPAFMALRLAGAAYLMVIGLRILLARDGAPSHPAAAGDETPSAARGGALRRGFACEIANPKTAVAFTGVIPQFVGPDAPVLLPAAFGLTFAVLGFVSLLLYCAVFSRAARVVRPRLTRALVRSAAGALVAFGGGLAVGAARD